jgi:hypothetical protein
MISSPYTYLFFDGATGVERQRSEPERQSFQVDGWEGKECQKRCSFHFLPHHRASSQTRVFHMKTRVSTVMAAEST